MWKLMLIFLPVIFGHYLWPSVYRYLSLFLSKTHKTEMQCTVNNGGKNKHVYTLVIKTQKYNAVSVAKKYTVYY